MALAGWAIVAAFVIAAVLMALRVLPALLAVPLLALAMAALSGVGLGGLATIAVDGTSALAVVAATVIFGALLGRVTIETRIAETIVKVAAEFGGDRPIVVALAMSLVVAILFTSMSGLGAIIMVGSIVLPIMLTVGVPRTLAATLFLLAFALGFVFNLAQWTLYAKLFSVSSAPLQHFAIVLAAIDAVALVGYAVVKMRSARGFASRIESAPIERKATNRVPAYALITPLLPLVLYLGFGMNALVAFALSAIYGVLTTRPRDAVRILVASWIRGLEDVAPAVLLLMGIGMLLAAAKTPAVAAALSPVVAALAPRNAIAYVVVFGLLSPLALYRGPLNPLGVGIGVYTILATMHVLPPIALVAAVMAVVQVQNPCDPTNTQNVWIANFTGVSTTKILRAILPLQVGVATVATIVAVAFAGPLFGVQVYALAPMQSAAAATLHGGLAATPVASNHLAVQALDSGANPAATAIAREVGAWPGVVVAMTSDDPSASDCSAKTYAAALRVASSVEPSAGGFDVDVAVSLVDCAGWDVDEFHAHEHARVAPSADRVAKLGLDALLRVRTWMHEHPAYARRLLESGVAYDPESRAPTYFYTLYKTTDGYMRAWVRPGGPAYEAGMRTSDIVDKLDGRFWWEYGTYQTQLRAYDGKPHTFELTRGTQIVHASLGEPYVGRAER